MTMPGNFNPIELGFGAIKTKTIMDIKISQDSMVPFILVVNTPQVALSILYFLYNALFTGMSLVTEWDRFSNPMDAKSLRVSSAPRGAQRSTYFLQLPYRYALPLVTFSGSLHWLISQSLFLVNLEMYGPSADDPLTMVSLADDKQHLGSSDLKSSAYSPIGIICVVFIGLIMIGFLLGSAGRRLRFGGIPVAGSCSAAISAACHPDPYEVNMWEKKLRWGVVRSNDGERESWHCSFSSRPVEAPVHGNWYM